MYNVGLWLGVDFLSLVINGILLWNFCKVNILRVVQNLQKECWIIFALAEAWIFMEVLLPNSKVTFSGLIICLSPNFQLFQTVWWS